MPGQTEGWMKGWKDGWKGGQTLFHRTLPANAGGPKTKIEFLNALVYEDINNKLQTILYKKTNQSPKLFTCKLKAPQIINRKHSLKLTTTS